MSKELKHDSIVKNIIIGVIVIVALVFAYFGFFPFNLTETEHIHIKVYDSAHLAFNIPNIKTSEGNYYCSLRLKEIQRNYVKDINTLEQSKEKINQAIIEIDGQIKQSPAYLAVNYPVFRHSLTSYDINRLNQLYKARTSLENQLKTIDNNIEQLKQKMFRECKKF